MKYLREVELKGGKMIKFKVVEKKLTKTARP